MFWRVARCVAIGFLGHSGTLVASASRMSANPSKLALLQSLAGRQPAGSALDASAQKLLQALSSQQARPLALSSLRLRSSPEPARADHPDSACGGAGE